MKKGIFARSFLFTSATIIVSVVILCGLLVSFGIDFYHESNKSRLVSNALIVASDIVNGIEGSDKINEDEVMSIYNMYARLTGAEYHLIDNTGLVVLSNENAKNNLAGQMLPDKAMRKIFNSPYYQFGKLEGIFDEVVIAVAVPVYTDGNASFYVLIARSAQVETNKMFSLVSTMIVVMIFLLIGGIALQYLKSRNAIKSINEMTAAVKAFGRGDFEGTVDIPKEKELAELATALNQMEKSLSGTERMRQGFIENVSHELKTPMTTISGFVDGIIDGTVPVEKQGQYLKTISDEVKRLSRLVRSMLDLSQIEAGEKNVQYSSFDIVDMTVRITLSFESGISAKSCDVLGLDHEPVVIMGDKDMLHQVIYNVCENAVKFVDQGGYIEYNWQVLGDNVEMRIKNSGKGLEKEELPRLFDRFYKTEKSRGQDKSGVGLGLFIVRSIIKLHGGDIIVESEYGEYTEFIVTLPMNKK